MSPRKRSIAVLLSRHCKPRCDTKLQRGFFHGCVGLPGRGGERGGLEAREQPLFAPGIREAGRGPQAFVAARLTVSIFLLTATMPPFPVCYCETGIVLRERRRAFVFFCRLFAPRVAFKAPRLGERLFFVFVATHVRFYYLDPSSMFELKAWSLYDDR
jgi:hypothetical protein